MPLTYSKARTISRTLLAIGLVCAILFTLSTRLSFGTLIGSHHTLQCSSGLLIWQWSISDLSNELVGMSHFGPLYLGRSDGPLEWSIAVRDTPVGGDAALPLIYPMLATLIPGIIIAYRHRFRPGHCRRCGYDLAGLEGDAPCPECGRAGPFVPSSKGST